MEENPLQYIEHRKSSFSLGKRKFIATLFCIVVCITALYYFLLSSPRDFPIGDKIEVEHGATLHSVSAQLKNKHIIRSTTAFEAFAILYGGEHRIVPADYVFDTKVAVWTVARRISGGGHIAPVVVTIPEGFNKNEIADVYDAKLINFDKNKFLATAKEGSLFPDTYYFFSTDNETDAIDSMTKNFEKKIAPIRPEIASSGKTENQIITMASILEREAKGDKDRGIISGILWKRISLGMPLQVDAAPLTYKTKGLPNAPIGNPGLEAINAAIYPQSSGYLYYLHDKEGNTHYAKTFEEHKKNIAKYLK